MSTRRLALSLAAFTFACTVGSTAWAERFIDSPNHRDGFAAGIAVGPSALVGLGIDGFSGAGGGLSMRVGTTAGERFMWWLQLDSDTYLVQKSVGVGNNANGQNLLTVAGQLFFRDALWVKAGAGFADQFVRKVSGDDTGAKEDLSSGLAVFGSAGVEFLRRSHVALDIEVMVGLGIHADGVLGQGSIRLGFTYY